MRTIYIDVLIVLNIYVNFFLLRITAKVMHFPVRTGRTLFAAFYASLYSLLILAPELPEIALNAIKLGASATVILVCFGWNGVRRLVIAGAVFYGSNMVLAGALYAVYSWLRPDFIQFANGVFYIDFSLIVLVVTTAAMYGLVCAARQFIDRGGTDCGAYEVIVRRGGDVKVLSGLADTGNCLVDWFSGAPVIVCSSAKLGIDLSGGLPEGYRLLPCTTVSDSGMMAIFKPDEVLIRDTQSGQRRRVEAVIGLGRDGAEAVFNPKILKI